MAAETEALATALARYVHKWGALDVDHGPYTGKCICNHHARELAAVIKALG